MNDNDDIVCPIALRHTHQATCVPRWYLNGSEHGFSPASYSPLINGEEAFKAVHLAIAGATKTVDIICWGFQPSMYFIRDDPDALSIGELLKKKAGEGVKVRVLGWEYPFNATGMSGEANLPGKGFIRIRDQALQSSTPEQYKEDQDWFKACSVDDDDAIKRAGDRLPLFVSRGFSWSERNQITEEVEKNALDTAVGKMTRLMQWLAPTHHQKSVMVDYEVPDCAVGFVMGHNMLDEYWDTNKHSALNRHPSTKPAKNKGPRGSTPRQDISCRLTGPILHYLNLNFTDAWLKETGEEIMTRQQSALIAPQLPIRGKPQIAQLVRTQSQLGVRDIEKAYLNAVNNATQFIYIENQYFRWPPLAEAIKNAAKYQTAAGRCPGEHGVLHLFVITNDSHDGIGPGTVNTQRMLESLGRADTIPGVTKLRRIEQIKKDAPPKPRPEARDHAGQRELRQWEAGLALKIKEVEDSVVKQNFQIPGLKVHICSLVADDSPAGQPWMPVYVHSKLMIVDDVYTIQGSANINTRSMQVDTELNIAHEWVSVTRPLRRRLWNLHTQNLGGQDDPGKAFKAWRDTMDDNRQRLSQERLGPRASLVEFRYGNAVLSDKD